MRAAVLESNGKIDIKNIELPKLDENLCRIKIKYSGVCSSDINRGFNNGAYFYPLIMGHEMSGEIVKVGDNVKDFKNGDRVAVFPLIPCRNCSACEEELYAQCSAYKYYGSRNDGGFCEYLDVFPWNLIKIPEGVSYKDAAALEPFAVVLNALKKTDIFSGMSKNITVIGAGFMGLIAVRIILNKLNDVEITLIDRNEYKLNIIKSEKVKKVCLKSEEEWGKYIDNCQKANIVLEATGSNKSFKHSIEIAQRSAQVVWMGNIDGDLLIDKKTVSSILRKELKIYGTWNSVYKNKYCDDWVESLELMQNGIKPSDLISHVIKLEELPAILFKMYKHKTHKEKFDFIKVMVNVNGD